MIHLGKRALHEKCSGQHGVKWALRGTYQAYTLRDGDPASRPACKTGHTRCRYACAWSSSCCRTAVIAAPGTQARDARVQWDMHPHVIQLEATETTESPW